MKKYLIMSLLFFPSISFAAPLTQEQANSLINIVQSFPGTPASTFTNLITAFSNITVKQAESLITVVQAAPGVPANSFVGLLIAFTEDQPVPVPDPAAQKITELNQKVDTLQNQLTETNQLLGTIQQNTTPPPPAPPPVSTATSSPPQIVVRHIRFIQPDNRFPYMGHGFEYRVLNTKGVPMAADVTISSPDNYLGETTQWKLYDGGYGTFSYIPLSLGTKVITFTSGSLSRTVTIEVTNSTSTPVIN